MGVVTREGEEREEVRIVPFNLKTTLEYEDAFHTYSTLDQVRKMFSDPSAHWVEERRRIREEAERPPTTSLLDQVDHALIFFAGFCNLLFKILFLQLCTVCFIDNPQFP